MSLFKTITRSVKDYAPEILTGINIAATIGAVVLSAEATPKALLILNEAEYNSGTVLTPKDKIKLTWRTYLPTGICTALAVGSSIGSAAVGAHQKTELLGALAMATQFAENYRQSVREQFGAEADKRMVIEATPAPKLIPGDVGVYETGDGSELFLDAWTGTLFRSSEEAITLAYDKFLEHLNFDIETFWPLNDLRDLMHLPDIGAGNHVGWTSVYKPEMEIDWDSDRQVYKIITFENSPLPEFKLRR